MNIALSILAYISSATVAYLVLVSANIDPINATAAAATIATISADWMFRRSI